MKLAATLFATLNIAVMPLGLSHAKLKRLSRMTPLAWCVSGRESGHEFSINTGNGYYGGYQFAYGTWLAVQRMMGVFFAPRADLATEAQQTAVFNYYEPIDPGAWPQTVPACGG